MNRLPDVLPAPDKPSNLPDAVKWLSGEGAGSWFLFDAFGEEENEYQVQRFSPEGKLECAGIFKADLLVDFKLDYTITYPSHCQKVTLIQQGKSISMIRTN